MYGYTQSRHFSREIAFISIPGVGGSGRFFFLRRNNITTMTTAAVPTTAIPTPTPAPIAGPLELLSSDGQKNKP